MMIDPNTSGSETNRKCSEFTMMAAPIGANDTIRVASSAPKEISPRTGR